jgi:hypothetical protein
MPRDYLSLLRLLRKLGFQSFYFLKIKIRMEIRKNGLIIPLQIDFFPIESKLEEKEKKVE